MRHVANGFPRLAKVLVEQREVVVAIGKARITFERLLVTLQRLVLAAKVLQNEREVVEDRRSVVAPREGYPVGGRGIDQPTRLVQEIAAVDVRIEEVRCERDGVLVGRQGGVYVAG